MATTMELTSLEEKVREFCEFVVEQESFRNAWKDIEAFLDDEEAREAYKIWQEKGSEIHHREHHGIEATEEEELELEELKSAVMGNSVAANFVQAEGHMNRIFGTMTKMLQKTLQRGRVPTADEMAESECCGGHGGHGGGCGGGCH